MEDFCRIVLIFLLESPLVADFQVGTLNCTVMNI